MQALYQRCGKPRCHSRKRADRMTAVVEQMAQLTGTMALLNESLSDDRRLRDHLAQLNANILQLSDDLRKDRDRQTEIISREFRALSSSLIKTTEQKVNRTKGSQN